MPAIKFEVFFIKEKNSVKKANENVNIPDFRKLPVNFDRQ